MLSQFLGSFLAAENKLNRFQFSTSTKSRERFQKTILDLSLMDA